MRNWCWVFLLFPMCIHAWGNDRNDKVLLKELSAITLHHGAMTAGRRSSPVPQLTCVGGTAGCHAPQPKVIQCYNRGWDGYDVQWECKAQMDKKYQLGRIEVTCEGYDYPDDPYILRGSCGLEYELDMNEQGYRGSDNRHYDSHHHYDYSHSTASRGSGIGSIIGLAIVILLIYACFKMCQSASRHNSASYGYTGSADSTGAYPTTGAGGTGRPGFWTGAGMGGLLGYMFGRGTGGGGYGGGYYRRTPHYGWNVPGGGGGGWGSAPRSSWSSGGSSSGGSHTTSGFGGTRRR